MINIVENKNIINKNIIITIVLMILYTLGIAFLKFRIATILFLFAYMTYFKIKSKTAIIIAFTMTYWLVFFFEYVFRTILP